MTGVSTIPATLSALIQLTTTALPDANVIDGEPLQGQPGDFIAIGYSSEGSGVDSLEQISDYGLASPTETYSVVSEIVAWGGAADIPACRARAYTMLNAISQALLTDSTLGDVVMLAQLGETHLMQMQTGKGAVVILRWAVAVNASKH